MLSLKSYPATQAVSTFKYRDRVAIIGDILQSVRETKDGRKKTQIMQSANLNYVQTKKYLGYLVNCGFIMVTEGQNYKITNRGYQFLQLIEIQKTHSLR